MRKIERFPPKQMYPYLSLVERKVAEFYHNIDRRRWLVWVKMTYFIAFSGQFLVSLFLVLPLMENAINCLSPPQKSFAFDIKETGERKISSTKSTNTASLNEKLSMFRATACCLMSLKHTNITFVSLPPSPYIFREKEKRQVRHRHRTIVCG